MKWLLQGHHVARLLGLFLLVTAGLKIHGLVVDPYGQENFLALPWLQVLTIEVEILLGLWLLSGVQLRWALVASLLLFCVFACLSFTLAWQGQEDCECFGAVKVNPWYTFGLDVVVITIVGLFVYRIDCSRSSVVYSPVLTSLVQVILTTAVMLSFVALAMAIFSSDPMAMIARLRGETLSVQPIVTQLGEGYAGEQRVFQVTLKNNSDKPIKVVGGTTSCSCIVTQDMPVTIPANDKLNITVRINFSGSPGAFTHRFALYSDSDERLTIARFAGNVISSNAPSKIHSVQHRTASTN